MNNACVIHQVNKVVSQWQSIKLKACSCPAQIELSEDDAASQARTLMRGF